MGHSQAEKAKSRQRILDAASQQLRELGLAGISIAELMKSAKLTHGGFYGHFVSRDDLIAEALDRALSDGEASALNALTAKGHHTLKSFLNNYLSETHRDNPGSGCAVSALAADVARADRRTRDVLTDYLEESFKIVGDLTDDEDPTTFGMTVMSTVVGAMILSRAVNDKVMSHRLLLSARMALLDLAEARQAS